MTSSSNRTPREARAAGKAILLVSADLKEILALCDRIAVIDKGLIVAEGTPGELKASVGPEATLDTVFRHYAGSDLETDSGETLRDVRSARRTARGFG